MGINKIFQFIQKKCPKAINANTIDNYNKKKIAYDASMVIYQFAISTQTIKKNNEFQQLLDPNGNLKGHLMGLLYRNIFFLKNGIKPCWVFDGTPPQEKTLTLEKRKESKNLSQEKMKEFFQDGDMISVKKYSQRSIYVTKTMTEDAKNLIRLLGLPVIEAPGEAEAQCSVLAKSKKVAGIATEDMDGLTFGSPVLLRNFNLKNDITEINLKSILEELDITYNQYIDLSILSGCDYCDSIKGIGPITAFNLIKKYKNIEGVLEFIESDSKSIKSKFSYKLENFDYKSTRKLFKKPNVLDPKEIQLKWDEPDFVRLRDFLYKEKRFGMKRIDKALERLSKI